MGQPRFIMGKEEQSGARVGQPPTIARDEMENTSSVMLSIRSKVRSMSVDALKTLFEIVGVVLIGLTFIAAALALHFAHVVDREKSEQLRQFDKSLTEAKTKLGEQQERAAVAEKALRDIDTKAEGFRLAIAKANERAAKAQESLALAEQHSAEADAKAEGFRLDIAQANTRAAEANRIAEQERLARLQLEARLADRILLPIQEQNLEKAFAGLNGKSVDVAVIGDTMEIAQFSSKIIDCMRKAGVLLTISRPIGGGSVRGVLVGVRADAPPEFKQTAAEFISILQQTVANGVAYWDFDKLVSGMAAVSKDKEAQPNSPLRIWFGSK